MAVKVHFFALGSGRPFVMRTAQTGLLQYFSNQVQHLPAGTARRRGQGINPKLQEAGRFSGGELQLSEISVRWLLTLFFGLVAEIKSAPAEEACSHANGD